MDITDIDFSDGLDRDEALALLAFLEEMGLDVTDATLNGEVLVDDDVDNTPDPDGVDTEYPFEAQPFDRVEQARAGILATGHERAQAIARAYPAAFVYPGMDLPPGAEGEPHGWFADNSAASYLSLQISQAMSTRTFIISAWLGAAPKVITPFLERDTSGPRHGNGLYKEVKERFPQIGLIRYKQNLNKGSGTPDQNRWLPSHTFTAAEAEEAAVAELLKRVKRFGVETQDGVDFSPSGSAQPPSQEDPAE